MPYYHESKKIETKSKETERLFAIPENTSHNTACQTDIPIANLPDNSDEEVGFELRERLHAMISHALPEFYEYRQTGHNTLNPKQVDIQALQSQLNSTQIPTLMQPIQKLLSQAANAFLDRFRLFREEKAWHNNALAFVKFRLAVKEAGWEAPQTRDYNEALKHANRLSGYLSGTLHLMGLLNDHMERQAPWENIKKTRYDSLLNELLPVDPEEHNNQYTAQIRGNLTKKHSNNIKFNAIVNSVTLDERIANEALSTEIEETSARLLSGITLTKNYAGKTDENSETSRINRDIFTLCQVLQDVINRIKYVGKQIQPLTEAQFEEHQLLKQKEDPTLAAMIKRKLTTARKAVSQKAQGFKSTLGTVPDKINKNTHCIAHTLPRPAILDTDTVHHTNKAVFRAGIILLDKIQQTTSDIYKARLASRPFRQTVTHYSELKWMLSDMEPNRILDAKLRAEYDRWREKAEGLKKQLQQILGEITTLAEEHKKQQFLSVLRNELNHAPEPMVSNSIISEFDTQVKVAVDGLASIEKSLNQTVLRLSEHGEAGGKELDEKIVTWLQNLNAIKGQLKTSITKATGQSINNFSRTGMLARRMGEWNETEKQRYLGTLSAEGRTAAEKQYDTVFFEVIQRYLPLLSKESDPQGDELLQRLRLEADHAAKGTTLYPATMADILAGMKSTDPAIRDWSRRKLVRGVFLAACLEGVKLIPNLAVLPLRTSIKFVITGAKVARAAYKGRQGIRGGEGDINDEVWEYANRSYTTAAIKAVLSLPPGLVTILGVTSVAWDFYEEGLIGAGGKIAKTIVGEAPWRALDTGSRIAVDAYTTALVNAALAEQNEYLGHIRDAQKAIIPELNNLTDRVIDDSANLNLQGLSSTANDTNIIAEATQIPTERDSETQEPCTKSDVAAVSTLEEEGRYVSKFDDGISNFEQGGETLNSRKRRDYGMEYAFAYEEKRGRLRDEEERKRIDEENRRVEEEIRRKEAERARMLSEARNNSKYSENEIRDILKYTPPSVNKYKTLDLWVLMKWSGTGMSEGKLNFDNRAIIISFGKDKFILSSDRRSIYNNKGEKLNIRLDDETGLWYLFDEKDINIVVDEVIKAIDITSDIRLYIKNEMRRILYENKNITGDELLGAINNILLIELYKQRSSKDISYLNSILKARVEIGELLGSAGINKRCSLDLNNQELALLGAFFGNGSIISDDFKNRINKYSQTVESIKIKTPARGVVEYSNSYLNTKDKLYKVKLKVDDIIRGLYVNSSSIKDDFILINSKSIPNGIDLYNVSDNRYIVEYLSNFIFLINELSISLDNEGLIYDVSSQIQAQLWDLIETIEEIIPPEDYLFIKNELGKFEPLNADIAVGDLYYEALNKYVWGADSEEEGMLRLKQEINETSRAIDIIKEELERNHKSNYLSAPKLMFRADLPSGNINNNENKERSDFEKEKSKKNNMLTTILSSKQSYLTNLNRQLEEQLHNNKTKQPYFTTLINDMELFHSIDFSMNNNSFYESTSSLNAYDYWESVVVSEINIGLEKINTNNTDCADYHFSKAKYIQIMISQSKEYKELASYFENKDFQNDKDYNGDYRDIIKAKTIAGDLIKKNNLFKGRNINHISAILYYMIKYKIKNKEELLKVNPQHIHIEYFRDLKKLNPIGNDELPPEGYYAGVFFRRRHFSSQYDFNEQFNLYEKKYSKYESKELSKYLYASVIHKLSISELQQTPQSVFRFKLDNGGAEDILYIINREEESILVWHINNEFTIDVKKKNEVPTFLKTISRGTSIALYPNFGSSSQADVEKVEYYSQRTNFMKNYNFGKITPSLYGSRLNFDNKSTIDALISVSTDVFNTYAEQQKVDLDDSGFWHKCATKLVPMYGVIYKAVTDSGHKWNVSEITDIVSNVGIILTLGVGAGLEITEDIAKEISNTIMDGISSGENRIDILIKIAINKNIIKSITDATGKVIYDTLDMLLNPMPSSLDGMFDFPYLIGAKIEKKLKLEPGFHGGIALGIDNKFEVKSSYDKELVPAEQVFNSGLNKNKYNNIYFDKNSSNDFYVINNGKRYRVRWGEWEHSWRLVDPKNSMKFHWTPAIKYEKDSGWVTHNDFGLKGGVPEPKPKMTTVPVETADNILKKEWDIRESYKELPYSEHSKGLRDIISLETSLAEKQHNTLFFNYNLHSSQSEYMTVYRVEVAQRDDKYMHTHIDEDGNVNIYVPGMAEYPSNRELRINSEAEKSGWYTAAKDYIEEKKGAEGGNTAWYNFGNPVRALQFYEQKMENVKEKMPFIIKSFRIPAATFKAIAEDCTIEELKNKYKDDDPALNVDQNKGYNQIGLRPHHIRLISQSIIPHSGKTYSPEEFYKLTDVGLQDVSSKNMKIPRELRKVPRNNSSVTRNSIEKDLRYANYEYDWKVKERDYLNVKLSRALDKQRSLANTYSDNLGQEFYNYLCDYADKEVRDLQNEIVDRTRLMDFWSNKKTEASRRLELLND